MAIRFRLLGAVFLPDQPDLLKGPIVQRHPLALLALLSTESEGRLTRDKLLGFLWPETDERRARQLLSTAIYRIRRTLGEDTLVSSGDDVTLAAGVVMTDAGDFAAAVEEEAWEEAIKLYAGRFMDGFHLPEAEAFETWLSAQRERYDGMYRRALEALAVRAEERGELREAEEWLRRRGDVDPDAPGPLARRMLLLEALGERSRALELAAAHAARMQREFGAEPEPEVEAVARRLRESPSPAPVATPVRPLAAKAARASRDPGSTGRRRLAWLGIGAAVIAIASWRLLSRGGGEAGLLRVVAIPLENRTGDSTLAALGMVTADWLTHDLVGSGLVRVIPPSTVRRTLLSGNSVGIEDGIRLARRVGADLAVTGEYYLRGDSLLFRATLSNTETGELLRTVPSVTASRASPLDGVEAMRRRTIGVLATVVDRRLSRWAQPASSPPSLEAYDVFAAGLDAFFVNDLARAADLFAASYASDTSFTAPLIWQVFAVRNADHWHLADSLVDFLMARRSRLAPWDRGMTDYHAAYNRLDWEAAYRVISRLTEDTPGSDWLYLVGVMALRTNRPARTVEVLESLDVEQGWIRDWPPYWGTLATAYHYLGQYDLELAVIRKGRTRFPDHVGLQAQELHALAALGRVEEAEAAFELLLSHPIQNVSFDVQSLGVGFHLGDSTGRAFSERALALHGIRAAALSPRDQRLSWALLLRAAGRLPEARAVLDSLHQSSPDDRQLWGLLGVLEARAGNRREANDWSSRLEAQPYVGRLGALDAIRDRAEIAALLGETERAVVLLGSGLRQGLELRVPDRERLSLTSLKDYGPFRDLIRPKD